MNINDFPVELLQTIISWHKFNPRFKWSIKLASWQSTMLVCKTWQAAFIKCIENHPAASYDLLHHHFRFSSQDSWKSKRHAKLTARAKLFLTLYGHSIDKIHRSETSYKTCKVIARSCPNLTSLQFYSLCQTKKLEKIIVLFKAFTKLTELIINTPIRKVRMQHHISTLPQSSFLLNLAHFSQLKKLFLNIDLTSKDHLNCLKDMPQLEDLTLQFKDYLESLDLSLSNIISVLPNLKKLTIVIFGIGNYSFSESFFQVINNTNINELIITQNLLGQSEGKLSNFIKQKNSIHKYMTSFKMGGGDAYEFTGSCTFYFVRKGIQIQHSKRSFLELLKFCNNTHST